MRRRSGELAVVALVLAAGFAACGGGSGSLTRAEFIRKADAICRNAAKRVAHVSAPEGSSQVELASAAAKIVAAQRDALGELEALSAPSEAAETVPKWIALVDQTLDQAEASVRAQRRGDVAAAVRANTNGAALDGRADELARGYGMRVCVQAAAPPAP